MARVVALCIILAACAALSACITAVTPLPPEPTDTPQPSATPTATVIWFPPTSTSTVFPTPLVTPTLQVIPETGNIIFRDDFSDPENWNLLQTASTSIALGKNNLVLALDQPGAYLYTLRSTPRLDDFYLEITAGPSLCRAGDEYGLLLRVSPSVEFYRFSISCDSYVRVDKYYQGRASSPRPKELTGVVPPGAPSSSRLGVWASGKEIRFSINGEVLFTINDPSLTAGSLGLFIRSGGENALTVSFSDLVVRSITP